MVRHLQVVKGALFLHRMDRLKRMQHRRRMLILTLLRPPIRKQRAPRRWCVRPLNEARRDFGEFRNIVLRMRLMDDEKHFEYLRMSKQRFEELLKLVEPELQHAKTHSTPISADERLVITLRVLASGASQTTVAHSFCVATSTVHQILRETTKAIWNALQNSFVPYPTVETWTQNAQDFEAIWQFCNCIGAIDGKHVEIKKPHNAGSQNFNYKGTHSVVLMAVVNAKYMFDYVDIGGHGRQSDGGTWSACNLGKALKNKTLPIPLPKTPPGGITELPNVFLADAAFPMSENLLRPYPGFASGELTHDQRIYNYRHSRARRVVENAFGILASRWRIFTKMIEMQPPQVILAIQACIALHNFLIKRDEADNIETARCGLDIELADGSVQSALDRPRAVWDNLDFSLGGNRSGAYALKIRDRFCAYFNSTAGQVPWQESRAFYTGPK